MSRAGTLGRACPGRPRRVGLAGVLALVACGVGAPPAPAQPASSEAGAVVSVNGEGEVESRPDVAVVSAAVVRQAPSAEAALARSSEAMAQVLDALERAGVDEADVQTSGFQVSPLRRPRPARGDEPPPGPDIVGYEVTNRVSVRARDLDRLGVLLDSVVRAGANRLDGISFSLSDPTEAGDTARRRAVADARRRAELYASETGTRLGPVVRIEEEGGPRIAELDHRVAFAEAAAVPTAPGRVSVTARIRVTWSLEPL